MFDFLTKNSRPPGVLSPTHLSSSPDLMLGPFGCFDIELSYTYDYCIPLFRNSFNKRSTGKIFFKVFARDRLEAYVCVGNYLHKQIIQSNPSHGSITEFCAFGYDGVEEDLSKAEPIRLASEEGQLFTAKMCLYVAMPGRVLDFVVSGGSFEECGEMVDNYCKVKGYKSAVKIRWTTSFSPPGYLYV